MQTMPIEEVMSKIESEVANNSKQQISKENGNVIVRIGNLTITDNESKKQITISQNETQIYSSKARKEYSALHIYPIYVQLNNLPTKPNILMHPGTLQVLKMYKAGKVH